MREIFDDLEAKIASLISNPPSKLKLKLKFAGNSQKGYAKMTFNDSESKRDSKNDLWRSLLENNWIVEVFEDIGSCCEIESCNFGWSLADIFWGSANNWN